MTWSEVDFDAGRIEIPADRMKMKAPHIIPLSIQSKAILQDLHDIHRRGNFVFYSSKTLSRPISENAIRAALRTMLDEILEFPVDWIEHQLAHSVKDANGRAYNRTKHLRQSAEMMQASADYLDKLKTADLNTASLDRTNMQPTDFNG